MEYMWDAPQVVAFQQIIESELEEFLNASNALGEPLAAMSSIVKRAFLVQLDFIASGLQRAQPDEETFNQMTEPLSRAISEIQEFRERNRHFKDYFNHLSTVSESIVALSWISVRPAPVQFVRDMRDSGEYFGNRVLSSNKGDENHVRWVNAWNQVLRSLERYVRAYHTTGFTWSRTAPPPPPPPPQHHYFSGAGDATPETQQQALLTELNQGVDIVRMLKPVNRIEGRHRRGVLMSPVFHAAGDGPAPRRDGAPARRDIAQAGRGDAAAQATGGDAAAQATGGGGDVAQAAGGDVAQANRDVAQGSRGSAQASRGIQAGAPRNPPAPEPKFFLDRRKWRVENQRNNFGLAVENEDMSEALAMYRCVDTGLEVRNKMTGATIDSCKKSTVVLNDIISSVEVIRCDNVRIQCNGNIPLINIDSSESIQIFLTAASRGVEVISSKSSSCNICLLETNGDYVELPVPEQIKTVVADKGLKSSVVEKY